jgi:hypothetical protein
LIYFDGVPVPGQVVRIPDYSGQDPNCRPALGLVAVQVFKSDALEAPAGSVYYCSRNNDSRPCCRLSPRGCGGPVGPKLIRAGEYSSQGAFGRVSLSVDGGRLVGTYTSTWDTSRRGDIELRLDQEAGEYVGRWAEPAVGRQGILEDVEVSDDGQTIELRWRVTVAGQYRARRLPMNEGSARLTLTE